MSNSLDLTTFYPLYPVIDSLDEWNARVARDLATLDSLAAINLNRKYYYDKGDGKFYQSNWAIADTIKGWIGNWPASYLARGEEILYRNLWRLSYKDSRDGLLKVKDRIEVTLAIASATLEMEDRNIRISIPDLNQQILAIQRKFEDVKTPLTLLKWTYEDSAEKQQALQRVIVVFFSDSEKFVKKVLSQISAKLKPPEIAVSSKELQKLASVSSPQEGGIPLLPEPEKIHPKENEPVSPVPPPLPSAPPPAAIPASVPAKIPEPLPFPFAYPKREEEKAFNSHFQANLEVMKEYMENHKSQFEAQSTEPRRYKRKVMGTPWSVQVTPEGIPYMHHHISIVPPKQRGAFKKDKLAYHPVHGVTAKLSTKMLRSDSEVNAKNEEKFLRFFSQNKHPHIVETYDVIYVIVDKEVNDFWWGLRIVKIKKQIIFQQYGVNGELRNSLPRLINQPEKIKRILLGVLDGLAFFHANKVVHCDIKASNIFLKADDESFIGDLGTACDEGEDIGIRGTPMYMDPNMLTKSKATPTYDIWSFGMMMYGMLKKYPDGKVEEKPWEWLKDAKLAVQIPDLNRTKKDEKFPEPRVDDVWMHACWECLQLDPAKRPTAQQLLDRLSGSPPVGNQ